MIVQMIGIGLGTEALVTPEALQKIREADLVLSNDRLYDAFAHLNPNTKCCTLSEIEAQIREHKDLSKVAILASGDVGFYSLSNTLKPVLENDQAVCSTWPPA